MRKILLLLTFIFAAPLLNVRADEALARKYFLENDYKNAYQEYEKTAGESLESFVAINKIREYQFLMKDHLPYLIELYKKSEDPNPLLFFVVNSEFFRTHLFTDVEDEIEFLEECLEDKRLNPQVKALLQELISDMYLLVNEFDKSEEAIANLGTIENWAFVGPFENISTSGYDKKHGPESNPKKDAVFAGKSEIDVRWFNYNDKHPGKWISLAGLFDIEEALFFTQSFVYSEQDQEVVFGLGVSGSVKFWVNDNLIFTEPTEYNNGMDTYLFTAKLNKGYNRILMQLGSGVNDKNNFLLRVLDKNLNPMPKFKSSAEYQDYVKESSYKSKKLPNFALQYYEQNIKGTEKEPVLFNVLADFYLMNNMNLEYRKRVEELISKYPDNYNLLQLDMKNTSINPDLESSYLVKKEMLKDSKFKNNSSALARLDELFKKEDWESAQKTVDSLENEGAGDFFLSPLKVALMARNEEYRKMVDETMAMYEKYPTQRSSVKGAFAIFSYDKKLQDAAYKVYEDYLDDYYDYEMTYSLAQYYWRTDRRNKAEKLFDKLDKYSRGTYSLLINLGDFYKQQGNFDKALTYYYRLLERVPYVSSLNSRIGDCYKEQNQTDSALKYYTIALEQYPGDFDNRTTLRKLKNQKEIFTNFEEPDIDAIIANAKGADEYPDENAIILLIENHEVLYKSGASEEVSYFVGKPLTQTGVDMFKEINLGYSEIIKAEVIKQDGSRVQADKSGGMVVFTKLEPGDAIYYKTKSLSYSDGALAKYFETSIFFNTYLPLEEAKLALLVEDGIDITYKATQCELKPEISKVENMTMYKWAAKGMPQIESETLMPPISDVCAMVHVSTVKDWDFISKWYYDVSNPKTKSTLDIERKVQELFAGKSNLTELEKAKVIYKYISDEIRYSSVPFRQSGLIPQNPTMTIDAKIGDCKDVSVLFAALAKAVGLDAEIVLVSDRENGRNELALPSIGFEHVIGKITIDGKVYYVELTTDVLPFGAFFGSSKKSYGLEISNKQKNELFQIDPATRPENAIVRNTKAKLDNGNLIIEVNSTKVGGPAASMRAYYRDQTEENQRKSMARSISEDYSSTELIDLKFDESIRGLSDSVSYYYSYKVKKPYTEIKNMKILRFPWSDILSAGDITSSQERKYPLALWLYLNHDNEYNKVEFEIPDGMKVSEMPESLKLTSEYADYEVKYRLEGNRLIGERTVIYKKDLVPNEKYHEFKKFYDSMVESDNKQIALETKK